MIASRGAAGLRGARKQNKFLFMTETLKETACAMRPSLRAGARGAAVFRLQGLLWAAGFDPGPFDGVFGRRTGAALEAFLRRHGSRGGEPVEVDEAVWRRLEDHVPEARVDATAQVDDELLARLFPHAARKALSAHWPPVRRALCAFGLAHKLMVAMALATVRAESAGFVPVAERISPFNTSPGGTPFDRYDWRRDLGNRGPPDGRRYRGRGFVQLTGRANYARVGRRLGLGERLLRRPELALEPGLAAEILALFLAERRRGIERALRRGDLRAARRLVNGGLHGFAAFRSTLLLADDALEDPLLPRGRLGELARGSGAPSA